MQVIVRTPARQLFFRDPLVLRVPLLTAHLSIIRLQRSTHG